jgi:hypothetical protein
MQVLNGKEKTTKRVSLLNVLMELRKYIRSRMQAYAGVC